MDVQSYATESMVGAPTYCTRCHGTGDDFILTFRFEGVR